MNAALHQNALPSFSVDGKAVLDIGCADGDALRHPFYSKAKFRFGVDIDSKAIRRGADRSPWVLMLVASAEDLPFPGGGMDVVTSKVSLVYTDLRKSFAEIHRVLKPGGQVFLTMHDWKLHRTFLWRAIKARAWVRAADLIYGIFASWVYLATGFTPASPITGTRESFQTQRSLRRDLTKAGFTGVTFKRTDRDFIVHARK